MRERVTTGSGRRWRWRCGPALRGLEDPYSLFFLSTLVVTPDEAVGWRGVVLIADDHPEVLDVEEAVLGRAGFYVLTACSGLEAVRLFEHNHEEVVLTLTDQSMPGLPGTEVFRHIRRRRSSAVVVLTSGLGADGLDHALYREGLAAFLPKPFRPRTLLATVWGVLRQAEARGDAWCDPTGRWWPADGNAGAPDWSPGPGYGAR